MFNRKFDGVLFKYNTLNDVRIICKGGLNASTKIKSPQKMQVTEISCDQDISDIYE